MDDPASELNAIFQAADARARAAAWERFVERYSALLLKVCRSLGGGYDAAMDRYAFVLDELRSDDYRRLRTFVADGRSKVSTWLVVVSRRLCLDHHRRQYGRARAGADAAEQSSRRTRRDLVDLVSQQFDLDEIAQEGASAVEHLEDAEWRRALRAALDDLEPRDRLLLRLRFGDDLSAPEIARILSFPTPFHVYRRLKQLLEGLRRALLQSGIEDPIP